MREATAATVRRRSKRGSPKPSRRADGRWAIRFTYPRDPSTGRPSRKSRLIYGRTPEEAQAKWDAERELVDREAWRPDGGTPFAAVATEWLKRKAPDARHRQGRPVRRSTFERDYELRVRLHALPYLGPIAIERVGSRTLDDWQTWLTDNGRSDDTISRALGRVKQVLDYAYGRQLIGGDRWWATITGPVARQPRRGVVRDSGRDQIAGILAAIEGHYLAVMYEIAVMLGPRPGELRGLLASGVDAARHTITLDHTLDWASGGLPVLEDAKTERSNRTIRLPDSLWARFERYLAARDTTPILVLQHGRWIAADLVFRRTNGRPLRGDGAGGTNDLFKRCLRRAGLAVHNVYQLRHLAVAMLLEIGRPDEVAQILGHSSYRLTLDTYAPRMRELLERTAIDLEGIYAHLRAVGYLDENGRVKRSDKVSDGQFKPEVERESA